MSPMSARLPMNGVDEANALFFGEGHNLDVVGQEPGEVLSQILNEGERDDHAKDSVVRAGIGHGINVRADDQARGLRLPTGIKPAQISGRIDMRGHAQAVHPGAKKFMHVAKWRRKVGPREITGGLTELRYRVACVDYLAGCSCGLRLGDGC